MAAAFIQDLLYFQKVILAPYERMGYEIDVGIYGPVHESSVLFRQGGQGYVYSGDIHALPALDHPAVLSLAQELVSLLSRDEKVYRAIIYENMRPHGDIAHEIPACGVQHFRCALPVWAVMYLYPVTVIHHETDCRLHGRKPDFGTFRVYEYRYPVGHRTHIVHDSLRPFKSRMRGIDPDYVHSAFIQFPYEFLIAVDVRDGAYYLGLLFKHNPKSVYRREFSKNYRKFVCLITA